MFVFGKTAYGESLSESARKKYLKDLRKEKQGHGYKLVIVREGKDNLMELVDPKEAFRLHHQGDVVRVLGLAKGEEDGKQLIVYVVETLLAKNKDLTKENIIKEYDLY